MNRKVFPIFTILITIFILISGSPVVADTPHCGNLGADEIWANSGNVHVVNCDVIVPSGVTLTISEGTIVKFEIGTGIYVDGTLQVLGTSANLIYFTSIHDDTVGGDTNGNGGATTPYWNHWRGIEFRDGSNDANTLIDYAEIRYAGADYRGNINLDSASPTIQNSTLTNGYMAIRANLDSFPTLTNNTYTDNSFNGFGYDGGTINTNAVWDITDTSYYIINDVYVASGKTLTINPDAIIKFEIGRTLVVDGTLRVLGTSTNLIYFTSIHDDTVGGDTNGNGGASTPYWNHWRGIEFRDGSNDANSLIDYAEIRYAGADYRGNINLDNASPTIQNSTLTNSYYGIKTENSSPILGCNDIANNEGYGLFNSTTSIIVNAQNQWWGSASGPYHPSLNPSGSGNQITDGVIFSPWRQSPCGTTVYNVFLPTIIK